MLIGEGTKVGWGKRDEGSSPTLPAFDTERAPAAAADEDEDEEDDDDDSDVCGGLIEDIPFMRLTPSLPAPPLP
jgi:hypothetical protein